MSEQFAACIEKRGETYTAGDHKVLLISHLYRSELREASATYEADALELRPGDVRKPVTFKMEVLPGGRIEHTWTAPREVSHA